MENHLNPFGGNSRAPISIPNVSAEVEGQRAIQEVQASVLMARRFPRDPLRATDRILQACARPMLAEGASYAFSRGGTLVTGPSIHLARVIAGAWGNIQYGIRELSQEEGVSTVEAFAWDLETNTRASRLFQVRHVRFSNKKGFTKLEDPRDIYELAANYGARRLRACILELIPDDVIEAAQKQCDVTLKNNGAADPERVEKLVQAFKEFGVTREMINRRLNCSVEKATAAQIIPLRKVYASLRDGMGKVEDFFAAPEAAPVDLNGTKEAAQRKSKPPVQSRKTPPKKNRDNGPPDSPPPAEEPPPIGEAELSLGEPTSEPNPDLVRAILQALTEALTEEELAEAEDLIRELKHPEDQAKCQKMLAQRRATLVNPKEKS